MDRGETRNFCAARWCAPLGGGLR